MSGTMRKFKLGHVNFYVAVGVFLTNFINSGSSEQAVFFDEPNFQGSTFTLSFTTDCYTFNEKWSDRVVSIQLNERDCMVGWTEDDCSGQSLEMSSNNPNVNNLAKDGFSKRLRSLGLCSSSQSKPDFRQIDNSQQGTGRNDDDGMPNKPGPQEINFYDRPNFSGSMFTLNTHGSCYTFKSKWTKRVSSFHPQGNCLTMWDGPNCSGESLTLQPKSKEIENLKTSNFDKRIASVQLCPKSESENNNDETQTENRESNRSKNYDMGNGNAPKNTDTDIKQVALEEHNRYRRKHGVKPLQWDTKVESVAQKYADYLAQTNQFHHSTDMDNDYGENLAGMSPLDKIAALRKAITLWYDEIHNYDFNNPGYSVVGIKAGHFTQMIWKETTHVGVGMTWNPKRKWWVIVANYDPPGNFRGAYGKNVLPVIE